MDPTPHQIADVLDRAADELLMRGWTKGDYSHGERVCALGAINCAIGLPVDAGLHLGGHYGYYALRAYVGDHVPRWNDDPGRTEDDVHDALRGCAKKLRESPASSVCADRDPR